MPEHDEKNPAEPALDISEYIPGNDLDVQAGDEKPMDEAQRKEIRKRLVFRRKLFKGLLVLILAVLLLSVGIELNREMPLLVQYIFLYFLFEAMFTDDWTLLVTAGVMLLCFGLTMALIMPWKIFVYLTCIALVLFIRHEEKVWLRVLNILMFGTWVMFTLAVLLQS